MLKSRRILPWDGLVGTRDDTCGLTTGTRLRRREPIPSPADDDELCDEVSPDSDSPSESGSGIKSRSVGSSSWFCASVSILPSHNFSVIFVFNVVNVISPVISDFILFVTPSE